MIHDCLQEEPPIIHDAYRGAPPVIHDCLQEEPPIIHDAYRGHHL